MGGHDESRRSGRVAEFECHTFTSSNGRRYDSEEFVVRFRRRIDGRRNGGCSGTRTVVTMSVTRSGSVSLEDFAFQACSIDHSDISPL
jgi:hypothetical protein